MSGDPPGNEEVKLSVPAPTMALPAYGTWVHGLLRDTDVSLPGPTPRGVTA